MPVPPDELDVVTVPLPKGADDIVGRAAADEDELAVTVTVSAGAVTVTVTGDGQDEVFSGLEAPLLGLELMRVM